MSTPRSVRLCLLTALAACGLLLGALAAQASADQYGELSRFSAGVESAGHSHAFAVDAAEGNDIFIGSEPKEHEYEIKKFSEDGTELAAVKFTPPSAEYPLATKGIEGIAIDGKRLYVLILSAVQVNVGPAKPDAGALYAFSTEPSGTKLVPASGITNSEGLFAPTAILHASSKAHGGSNQDPLMGPAGITVDPTSHEVIILGVDEESAVYPPNPHVALQRVAINASAAAGTPAGELGARYIDPEEESAGGAKRASSPVVSPTGKVYFEQAKTAAPGQLLEIVRAPESFSSTAAPKPVYTAVQDPEAGLSLTEELVELDPDNQEELTPFGGALSFTSEGGGRLYSAAAITEDEKLEEGERTPGEPPEREFEGEPRPGVLALHYQEKGGEAEISELGWTGGQKPARVEKKVPVEVACSIGPGEGAGTETYPLIAAASGEKLFVLGWTDAGEAKGVETRKPIVKEFGPGGEGCPHGHGEMIAENEESLVKSTASVPAGTELALAGIVFEGNAFESEWKFDEGMEPTVSKVDEHQETSATHDFECNGPGGLEPTVTETVHTDDLAEPTVTITRKFKLLEEKPVVHKNPVNATAPEGGTATFTAVASGCNLKVQWEVEKAKASSFEKDTSDPGNTTGTLTVEHATSTENGNKYKAEFTNAKGGPVASKEAALTVTAGAAEAPKVKEQPTSVEVLEGAEAAFKATASGNPAPTVQWEESIKGGAFTLVSGATSETLKIAGTKVSESGDEYRAVFTNASGKAETNIVTLTVNAAPKVTKQPVSSEVAEGAEATFEAIASGTPAPTVQWEESVKGGAFTAVSGATSDMLKITGTKTAESGDEYRAVFKNSVGKAETNAATLTVVQKAVKPEVTEQPKSAEVAEGAEATFKATATGTPAPAVQWWESTNKGASFSEVSGATSNTLTIVSTKISESGDEYKAVFKNSAGSAETSAATLTVTAPPKVTKQPVSIEVIEGADAMFEATASGSPTPTVQWEESTNKGASFAPVSGATSDTLEIASAKLSESGDEYKAVFKNSFNKAETIIVTLTVASKPVAPKVTEQPKSVEALEGAEATFEADASGKPTPTVQWEESTNGGASFSEVSGATSDTLKIPDTKLSESGDEYKAVFKNSGGTAATNIVTLTVNAAPKVTRQPVSTEVTAGSEATFEATASGNPTPTVQWEESTNKGVSFSVVSGATSDTLKIANTNTSESGDEYKAVFKNSFNKAETTIVTLTVNAPVVTKPPEEPGPGPGPGPVLTGKVGESQVLGVVVAKEGLPDVTLAGTSLKVSSSGKLTLAVKCPAGLASCAGTVTLRTLTAVIADVRGHAAKSRAKVLTLATGTFTVGGGQSKTVTLYLTGTARQLLAHSHTIRAGATILAHNPSGVTHSTIATVALRLAIPAHHG